MPPPKPGHLRLGVSQSHTQRTLAQTLAALERTARRAAAASIDLLLFPEAYLGGYPRTATFGSAVGARAESGREQFRQYFNAAVDLGDTPRGEGERWVRRELERPRRGAGDEGQKERGDGTREELERVARETGVFLVVGCVERAGGTLYCAVVYVCPREGCLGKRRKVMPTAHERLIWGQGQPATLRAVTTTIHGVRLTLAAAICWENYMPLLRQALYAQNVNVYLAPTADARDTWEPLMRTVACEGRCVVLSANQCVRRSDLPAWIRGEDEEGEEREGEMPSPSQPQSQRAGRRVSIIEDGNEIVLPSPREPIANGHPEERRDKGRRVSIFDEGNEIVLPAEPLANGHDRPSADISPKSTHPRRVSVIDDGNEIALPRDADGYFPAPTKAPSSSSSDPFVSRGGSCIVSPLGAVLAGPVWEEADGLAWADVDLEDCTRGRLDMDVAGHYSRSDAFRLDVAGLDLSPPV